MGIHHKRLSIPTRRFAVGAALALALGVAACDDDDSTNPPPPPPVDIGRRIFGVDNANNLVRFGATRPDVASIRAITGLVAGDAIVGIDFWPIDNRLYALGRGNRIYTIDTTTAAATQIGTGTFTPALTGSNFGFDFNPVSDRIRVHTDADQNLRIHPLAGTVTNTDGTLAYQAGDPGVGVNPVVTGSAYTNSVAPAPTSTVLFAIDAGRDVLVTLPDPNSGLLRTVGALSVLTTESVGFDIAGNSGIAYATLTPATGPSRLHTINLTTGAAAAVGTVAVTTPIIGIAVTP